MILGIFVFMWGKLFRLFFVLLISTKSQLLYRQFLSWFLNFFRCIEEVLSLTNHLHFARLSDLSDVINSWAFWAWSFRLTQWHAWTRWKWILIVVTLKISLHCLFNLHELESYVFFKHLVQLSYFIPTLEYMCTFIIDSPALTFASPRPSEEQRQFKFLRISWVEWSLHLSCRCPFQIILTDTKNNLFIFKCRAYVFFPAI